MKVSDLKTYVEVHIPYKYVINEFHSQTPDNCCVVLLESSGVSDKNVSNLSFQFLVRNADAEQAEAVAFDIYNHFNNKTDFEIGQNRVVFSRGEQSVPLYTGKDENDRYIYSVNINAIVDL